MRPSRPFVFCLCVLGIGAAPVRIAAADAPAPLDFPAAVELALRQSPLLRQGQIQLDVRHMDEREARSGYWPAVNLQVDYLINAPVSVSEPFSLHFNTGEYNPVGAYFSVQARREISLLAQLAYLQAIGDGLRQAGDLFLTLAALEQAKVLHAEQMDWGRRHVAWCANRTNQFGAPLELQTAEQELVALRLEGDRAAIQRRQALRNLAALLGFTADAPPPSLQLSAAREQVLGAPSATATDRDLAEGKALELHMLEIQLRLQKLGVTGAYAEFLPRPAFSLRSTDPLDETQEQGLYFSAGLAVPLWDAGRRRLNIHRQKAILEQRVLERDSGQEAWRRRWSEVCDQRELADAEAALADQRVRLAELNFSRQQMAFDAGREDWPALRAAQQHLAGMRLQALEKKLAADRAALALRHFSRDLLDRYVTVSNLLEETAFAGSDEGEIRIEK